MIDSLEMARPSIEARSAYLDFGYGKKRYGLVTLHRPSNVDCPDTLRQLVGVLTRVSHRLPLIFPIHPRTRANLSRFGLTTLLTDETGIHLVDPMGYIDFMGLVFDARLLITDSGGVQEETTYLGVPCLTLRPNTERPVTITLGTNRLCTPDNLYDRVSDLLDGGNINGRIPDLWDGGTARRVADHIETIGRSEVN